MTSVLVSQAGIEAITSASTPPRAVSGHVLEVIATAAATPPSVISGHFIELVTVPLITPRSTGGIYIEVLTPAPLIDFAGWGMPIDS